MKILLVGEDDDTRRTLATTLQDGHVVRSARGDPSAIAIIKQEAPHVVLVSLNELSDNVLDLLRRVREEAKPPAPHVLVVGKELSDAFLVKAYQNGIDGEIDRGVSDTLLRARMDSLQRRLDPTARKANAPAGPPKGPNGAPLTGLDLIMRSAAWRDLRPSLNTAVSKFLSLGTNVEEIPLAPAPPKFACGIVLSCVAHEVDMRIAIGADDATAKALAVHLFGPECDDLEGDMMGEVTNICMGTMKTAFSTDALAFSAGLPQAIAVEEVLRPSIQWKQHDAFAIAVEGSRLVVHVGLRSKANSVVPVGSLNEGMVLAKDVFNPRGMLLLTAGTRLSQTMVDKLQSMLSPKHPIEVSAA